MRRILAVRWGILCLVVLWSFSSLSVFAASSATRSTSPPGMRNGSVSPLLFGSNLSLYNNQDFFVTDSHTQQLAQQSGIRFMRFPDRGDRRLYLAAAQEIQTLGMTPLAILPYDNASADLQLVQDMNGVFGSSIVYYEYGNEQDLQGVDVTAYTASWNRVVPTLKQAATNANFIGPVNFQVNPSYIATFAANANPRPDEVSWHEYTCSASDSEATCMQNLSHWAQHIADVRAALQQAIGTTLPVLITEWNIDPNPPDSKLSDAAFVTQWTEQALGELAASNVFGSNEYALSNNEYLAMISDASHTLNAQGQAFQALALQQHPLPPSPTPPTFPPTTPSPSPSLGTTPSPTVTISPSPTPVPTGTVSPSPVSCSSSTSSTPTSTPTPSPTSPPMTATPTGTSTEDAEHETVQPLPTISVSPVPSPVPPPATPAPTLSPLHVDASGQIVNAEGCRTALVGVNMGDLYDGDAGVGNVGKLGLAAVQARILWYKQHLPMNVVRVNFNATWWDSDVFVPKAHMHFRQWLEQYVAWQEQVGNYVELDGGPHFREPPCGGTITFCPSQNQARKDAAQSSDPFLRGDNITPLVQAWTDLSTLYAHDPAILYDVWNEPAAQEIPDQTTYFTDMNTLINTVRAHSPQSLLIVYGRGLRAMQDGRVPDYQQPNLVFDTHIYDGFQGTSPATGQHCSEPGGTHWTPQTHDLAALVTWAHSQQQGFLIDEWGGCYDEPAYHTALTTFAQAQGVGLVYFTADNLVTETHADTQATPDPTNPLGLALNANGQQVAATYQQMLASTAP